jgi:hypothetical protein
MQVSLTPHADKLVAQMMQLGFDNPAALIEVALERMAQEELDLSRSCSVKWRSGLKLLTEEISVPLHLMS